MLSKKKRVTKETFQKIMKEGKIFSTQLFLFYFIKTDVPHYAFVAPKGIFKGAVERNKHRRDGYNILRHIPIKSGTGIFIYKKQAIRVTQQEIKEDIIFILQRTALLK